MWPDVWIPWHDKAIYSLYYVILSSVVSSHQNGITELDCGSHNHSGPQGEAGRWTLLVLANSGTTGSQTQASGVLFQYLCVEEWFCGGYGRVDSSPTRNGKAFVT